MQQDSFSFVKKCHQCQQHNNLIHAPAQELRSQVASWPFFAWGLDLIDKISPPSSEGHVFIITATDYFTKWVEAVPLRSTTAEVICRFLLENIISRFGIPSTIISDNGTSFKNKDVKQFLEKYHIKHRFSTPYYPQSNGQAESSNKIIEQILRKTVNKHGKDWSTQLIYALWAYRKSVRIATGTTPYNLVYGADAIMPLELEIPSLRVSLKGIVDDDSYREQRLQ